MKKKEAVAVETLWSEVRELSLGTGSEVERLDSPPTPLRFLRDFVSPNKPCLISNATSHWSALSLWSHPTYLSQISQNPNQPPISLHLTPDGRADALAPLPNCPNSNNLKCFASAAVLPLPLSDALRLISDPSSAAVAYAQEQNDCFRSPEYAALSADVEADVPWASQALGCSPDAVNIWIGSHRSQTSFHKDHYENLYAVVSGQKHFLLLPPTDTHRMYIRHYPAAHYAYSQDTGKFKLELEDPVRYVPWCSVDPYPSPESRDLEVSRFPLYFNGPKPFRVTVNPGEILYLPSMWFHHVRQSPDSSGQCTIAINYWYDMQFDIKYAYFNFLRSIDYQSPYHPALPEMDSEGLSFGVSEDNNLPTDASIVHDLDGNSEEEECH